MRILVTGGSGFIGSHLIRRLLKDKNNHVFNIDKVGYASIPNLLSTDLILYILPVLSVLILFFSLKIMFYKAPKLRSIK